MAGSIENSWRRITAWLDENVPEKPLELESGASDEEIQSALTTMGLESTELREFLALCNGGEVGVFPSFDEWDEMAFAPSSIDMILGEWSMMKELVEIGEFADRNPPDTDGVATTWWNLGWIPFANNGGGDYYCIDTAPDRGGAVGQIISHSHESGEHIVLAPSLSDYLAGLAAALETGDAEYDEDYGVSLGGDDDDDDGEGD